MDGMAQSHLKNVRKAADQVAKAHRTLEDSILAAVDSGESLRDIAPYARLSYSRVYQIAREARKRRDEGA